MNNLDPSERLEVHAARIKEVEAGEISGREFVYSLVKQCGFSILDARQQLDGLRDRGLLAISERAAALGMVEFPIYDNRGETCDWRNGKVTSLFLSGTGAIVQTGPSFYSVKVPFSLYDLRLAK